ncbi:3-ketoacyl-ACP reductase [Bifidobacterium sp. DSM 109958]|uniref:3-ketoacyl-ACP reductase n=1 Tax=Bifidobacterium moraviense TaxID=2675323 RepID=A0A7Y0F1R8_9BIFI|nr:SDR family NAD(P)-dependent oxidoreductase [Bifidobacterium sp. DSM 109958]NMN00449.1 3-ketoacyl-ACP reductase [Bifidobacterium sp. DSM 109958]
MGRFDGKGVVVTGASSGMGHRIALDFAAEGATVVAVARRAERLARLVEEAKDLPGTITAYAGDVTVAETTDGMIDKAVELAGHLDVLVNNAGIMDEFKPVAEVTDELWDKVMDVNLVGPMKAMRKAVQVMLGQGGGNIVNVASIGGIRGARAGAAYTASKHAIVGLTENTAFMYAPDHIRCNVVCPGGVDTEVMNGQTEMSQLGIGRVMAGLDTSIPSGKVEDISTAVLYIASDDAKFMTGATIVIDGGVSCN